MISSLALGMTCWIWTPGTNAEVKSAVTEKMAETVNATVSF